MKDKFVLALIVTAALTSTAFYAFPKESAGVLTEQTTLAFSLAILVSGAIGVWFFLTSLKSFTANLRRVYFLLSAGIILFSLLQLQLLIQVLLFSVSVVGSVLLLVPWLLGSLFMYLGLRKLARLLDVKSIWRSFWLTTGAAVAVAVAVALISGAVFQAPPDQPELTQTVMIILGLVGWSAMFSVAAGLLGLRIRQVIGVAYRPAMLMLVISQFLMAANALQEIVKNLTTILPVPYIDYGITLWVFTAASICMMRAAHLFKEVGQPTDALPATATPLDNVMYAASLVSNPRAVEEPLNQVRQITASAQGANSTLSGGDVNKLKQAYLQLEDYLIHREPLRKVDQAYIRSHLTESFRQQLGQT